MTPHTTILDRDTEPSDPTPPRGRQNDRERRSRLARALLVGAVAGITLYALRERIRGPVSRAAGALGWEPSAPVESIRDRADDVIESASPIPIGEQGDREAADATVPRAPDATPGELDEPDGPEPVRGEIDPEGRRSDAGAASDSGERTDDDGAWDDDGPGSKNASGDDGDDDPSGSPSDRMGDEPRSSEELDGLATDDIQEAPAEPGEMSVDEDIVSDMVDGDERENGDDDESA